MIDLWKSLQRDEAVWALTEDEPGLSAMTPDAEALTVAASFRQKPRMMVVVKYNLYTAQQLYRKLTPLLESDVLIFSVEESLRVEAIASSPTMYASQMETLTQLCLHEEPKVIITHPAALVRYMPQVDVFRRHIIELKTGNTVSMAELRKLLIESGYRYTNRVDQPLTFSSRGDVIDVFTIQENYPVRIEFFDDEIDSIRFFDLNTQRTIQHVKEVKIVPASIMIYDEDFDEVEKRIRVQLERDIKRCDFPEELEGNVERDIDYLRNHIFEHYLYRYRCFFNETGRFLDYVRDPQIILSTEEEIQNNITQLNDETTEFIRETFEAGHGLCYFSVYADYYRSISGMHCYGIGVFNDYKHPIRSGVSPVFFPELPLAKAVDEILRLTRSRQVILALTEGNRKMITEEMYDRGVLADKEVTFMPELFESGFNYENIVVLTARELFGTNIRKGRYSRKFNEAIQLDDYQDLNEGDYVVHNNYGIGRYQGIVTREIRGNHRDYLRILYKDDDELLVPLEQFRLVRKFVGSEGVGIRLNKIGSSTWNKTKENLKADVDDIAARLVQLYSDREKNIGFAFSPDDERTREFEKNFEFELTRDQKTAIREVKKDMESTKPMDRLLCGDVGFGKTEVAMVAAFKAINNLKQVAYLCPTTILSRQHYNTFTERFKGFPVKIALINRFVIESEQKRILKEVKEGKIDILIGTHRLLSQDVEFEDLGLLIIDEEQRFGVQAKEKIKELKRTIDVLSLSATPIPRTLQMSLIGVMSLSQLDTPPMNRMPIQTYVVEKNEYLVKEVIQRELARKGQVFYLHNNTASIYKVAAKLETQLPEARIAVAHGQMNRDEIEDVMYRFISGEYDVLVCTTIIETGIDISNANTIIIDKADTFGLSQLYQIRGRVGRSDRIAYAYLMHDPQRQLSEVATKRLQAIKDFTELGSGYKVALRDLTIRGAGDLLGEKQAGFINTVGMDMYLDMLQDALNEKKGIVVPHEEVVRKKISDVDGYIPENFAPQDYEKITLYQRIDKLKSLAQLSELEAEITDRYGKLPNAVKLLFEKKRIEVMLESYRFDRMDELEKECRLVLSEEFSQSVDGVKLFEQIMNLSSDIKLRYNHNKIALIFAKKKNWLQYVNRAMIIIEKMGDKNEA